ncbi:MAG: hypothetical protein LIP16_03300 [Clostridium sp.]|nr:hypothetical protein [Clostridium sp.]
MKRTSKFLCLPLSCFLVFSFTVPAYASSTAALTPTDYIASLLSKASGVDLISVAGTSSLFGMVQDFDSNWDAAGGTSEGYREYMHAKALNGELGGFMEWNARAQGQNKFDAWLDALPSWGQASWGDTVSLPDKALGSYGAVGALKEFLSTFPAYGTDSLDYWRGNFAERFDNDGLSVPPDNVGEYIFSSFTQKSLTYYNNYYFPIDVTFSDRPCAYSLNADSLPSGGKANVYFLYNDSVDSYANLSLVSHGVTVYSSTDSRTNVSLGNVFSLSLDEIKTVPFPVFLNANDAREYAKTGVIGPVYNNDNVSLPVKAVNPALQAVDIPIDSPVVKLPGSAREAQQLLDNIDMGQNVDDILKALGLAGLGVGAVDIPVDVPLPTETAEEATTAGTAEGDAAWKITLADILAKVTALPVSIANAVRDMLFPPNGYLQKHVSHFLDKFKTVFGIEAYDMSHLFSNETPLTDITITIYGGTATIVKAEYVVRAVSYFRRFVRGLICFFLVFYNINQFLTFIGQAPLTFGIFKSNSSQKDKSDL